ncbi:MAG: hypothetical protein U9N43_01405, partial [Euryarchaeota archaeon]|nr:hypothetical protein [Euryarchaeota archaeon]
MFGIPNTDAVMLGDVAARPDPAPKSPIPASTATTSSPIIRMNWERRTGQLLIYGTRNMTHKEFFMASTIESVAHLSRDLGMTEETLIREGIMEYIKSRIKACMRDRLEIMSRYQVLSLDEFEKGVQDGSIPEHPGWEDLI